MQTLAALTAGSVRPGRLGDLAPLLASLAAEVLAGEPPDLLLLASAKGDLPQWLETILEGAGFAGSPGQLAQDLARSWGCPGFAVGAACASGPAALAEAGRRISLGLARRVLVVGGDRLHPFVDEGFAGLGAIDPGGSRPFDRARAGITLGETVAAVVLEAGPGPVSLLGWGQSLDAVHLTGPARDGSGLAAACRQALGPHRPGLIIAHGTGTRANDSAEAAAYHACCPGVPVTAWKGGLGHSLGACGLTEVALAAEALARDVPVPGTCGLADPDDDLPVLRAGAHRVPGPWLSPNAGFGGMNSAVLVGAGAGRSLTRLAVRCVARRDIAVDDAGMLPRLTSRDVLGRVDPTWGRLDMACRLLIALGAAMEPWPHGSAVVLLSDHGSCSTDARFERSRRSGMPEIQAFPYTLASAPIGEASIRCGFHGPGMVLSGCADEQGRTTAAALLADGVPAVLLARVETGSAPEKAWVERWQPDQAG